MIIKCVRGKFNNKNNTIATSSGKILIIRDVEQKYPLVSMYFQLHHIGGNVYTIIKAMRIDTKEFI